MMGVHDGNVRSADPGRGNRGASRHPAQQSGCGEAVLGVGPVLLDIPGFYVFEAGDRRDGPHVQVGTVSVDGVGVARGVLGLAGADCVHGAGSSRCGADRCAFRGRCRARAGYDNLDP
jgi:hypothetical protein